MLPGRKQKTGDDEKIKTGYGKQEEEEEKKKRKRSALNADCYPERKSQDKPSYRYHFIYCYMPVYLVTRLVAATGQTMVGSKFLLSQWFVLTFPFRVAIGVKSASFSFLFFFFFSFLFSVACYNFFIVSCFLFSPGQQRCGWNGRGFDICFLYNLRVFSVNTVCCVSSTVRKEGWLNDRG